MSTLSETSCLSEHTQLETLRVHGEENAGFQDIKDTSAYGDFLGSAGVSLRRPAPGSHIKVLRVKGRDTKEDFVFVCLVRPRYVCVVSHEVVSRSSALDSLIALLMHGERDASREAAFLVSSASSSSSPGNPQPRATRSFFIGRL
ncbi:unnamed protein product [Pleuronectes platessa]|uniref:Uncharacterized protein n=1 Tax=Pleuronectes platessa TaxID=8262 RepID=A0A9N7TJ54_PLEPL|nr:unnamed protein product [Pleuronectes platessa]